MTRGHDEERDGRRLGRRAFLGGAALAGLAAACSDDGGEGAGPATTTAPDIPVPDLPSDPFTLGVASGDPTATSVILWTRLAPDPLEPGGGMPAEPAPVSWEVAGDEAFEDVARSGTARAVGDTAWSVHVDADGLEPDTWYWYRFRVGDWESPTGRARTTPEAGAEVGETTVAQVSCQRYEDGFFVALRDVADAEPDLVVHCGDYIYESVADDGVREKPVPEPLDLDGYRATHAFYKQDPDLQAAHLAAPWLVTWDDHEVDNNYRAGTPEDGSLTPDPDEFLARRAAAYQAWWEHMPVRLDPPDGPDLPIHRTVTYGDLARFHVLDTRQYRTITECDADSPIDSVGPRCEDALDPATTMLGEEQEAWLAEGLAEPGPVWDVLAQQVVLHQWRFTQGEGAVWNLDQWDGYPVARERLLAAMADAPSDVVVLTGDVHSSWGADLLTDFDDPSSAQVGVEFVAPGVASTAGAVSGLAGILPRQNPHIRYAESERRGWVLHTVTPERWSAEWRLVDDADREDSGVTVDATATVEPGGSLTVG